MAYRIDVLIYQDAQSPCKQKDAQIQQKPELPVNRKQAPGFYSFRFLQRAVRDMSFGMQLFKNWYSHEGSIVLILNIIKIHKITNFMCLSQTNLYLAGMTTARR